MPTVKLSGQAQGTTANTMPTSTSLQDISSHHKPRLTWNRPPNNNDRPLVHLSKNIVSSNIGRALNVSHSDDRIFEHPEVTIKPSALDDEIQRRLLTLKTSNTTESLLDQQGEISVPNILEHPDMRGPVVMLTPNTSSSSSALLLANDQKRIIRQQSVDVYTTLARTPPSGARVEFYLERNSNSKQTATLRTSIDDSSDQPERNKKNEPSSGTTAKESVRSTSELAPAGSTSDGHLAKPLQVDRDESK